MKLKSSSPKVQVPLLDVTRSNTPIRDEILSAISEIVESGQFVGGPNCQQFETQMASLCQTDFAVGCASGSDALLLALMALDVGPEDEVIVPSFTFFATVSAVCRLGAKPVFVDIDPNTFNMDPSLLPHLINDRTKAIIPVHLFGQCADMEPINALALDHNIFVIEDAAQAIGASYDGRMAGSLGHMACFSFYPTKNLGGFGDGGLVTTDDEELANRLRLLANHGMHPRYHHHFVGINSRLDAIQARVLSCKLKHLKQFELGRSRNAAFYTNRFAAIGLQQHLTTPSCEMKCHHVWNQYTVRIAGGRRDEVRSELAENGISTEIYYPIPMHMQPCFADLGYVSGTLPETELASREVLSLPIFAELTAIERQAVVDAITNATLGQVPYKMAS